VSQAWCAIGAVAALCVLRWAGPRVLAWCRRKQKGGQR